MSYSQGGLISATDYNTLGNSLNTTWGVGTGNRGWGQSSAPFAPVAANSVVTATQWSGLISKVNASLAHQGITTITPTSVTAGNLITYYSAISTGISSVNNAAVGQTGLALTSTTPINATYNGTWGVGGSRALQFIHTVTFSSGDAARHFFNAGGRIAVGFSRSGGAGTQRNTEWSALASNATSPQIGAADMFKVGGSGMTNVLNLQHYGYYGLTSTQQNWFAQNDNVGTYSTNKIDVYAYGYGTVGTGGGYSSIVVRSVWVNAWANAFQDPVTGTAVTSLVVSSPSTTYLTNTWGTPSATVTHVSTF